MRVTREGPESLTIGVIHMMPAWADLERRRSVAKNFYHRLTDNTIDAIAEDLLHNCRIFHDYPDAYPVKVTLVAILERETCYAHYYCQALAELLLS